MNSLALQVGAIFGVIEAADSALPQNGCSSGGASYPLFFGTRTPRLNHSRCLKTSRNSEPSASWGLRLTQTIEKCYIDVFLPFSF